MLFIPIITNRNTKIILHVSSSQYLKHKDHNILKFSPGMSIRTPSTNHKPVFPYLCSNVKYPVQFSPVNCCWSSPAKSYLVSSSVRTHGLIYIYIPKPFMCLEMGSTLRREEGFVFLSGRHICCTVFRTSVPALTQCLRKDICNLLTPYTLCYFATMDSTYARYTQYIYQSWLIQQITS
jgi:hypothetical protein